MRVDVKETKVYPFNELTDEAKQKALEKLYDINVNYDWWNSTYDDAAGVGIKINRGSFCKGEFIEDARDVAAKIMAEHGKNCETHKTAAAFLETIKIGKVVHETSAGYDSEDVDCLEYNETEEYEDFVAEFKYSILEDYKILLQKEYEYLTSKEAVIETIEANGYEFTEDGKLY